jgi:hypothetical protein
MRPLLLFLLLAFAARCNRSYPAHHVVADPEGLRLRTKVSGQRAFLSRYGFNPSICFLVDMRLPSGKNRFFVYDLRKDSVLLAGLVAHGSGRNAFSPRPVFSNVDGSGCSSLGRYRVGFRYRGQFGMAWKLYGLDSSNSRAFARNVVLHSYAAVPERETYPAPICNSLGCPMVSPGFLEMLRPLIEGSARPVCLYVFY